MLSMNVDDHAVCVALCSLTGWRCDPFRTLDSRHFACLPGKFSKRKIYGCNQVQDRVPSELTNPAIDDDDGGGGVDDDNDGKGQVP